MEVKISAVIIARNEEEMIKGALSSLSWVDEIIVVDQGSEDGTRKIAREFGARVVVHEWKGAAKFARARNIGAEKARGEWIIYIDADERVTKELRKEIQIVIRENKDFSFYAIPRENIIFGKVFKHGGFWPDYVKRLFRKEKLKKWQGELHEEPLVEGDIGYLKSPLRHLKHESLSEMVEKTNMWSEIEADLMYKAGHPRMNVVRFISAMIREFWHRMIKGLAFLDGAEGIMMAIYQVYSRFISYAKLWERQENESKCC